MNRKIMKMRECKKEEKEESRLDYGFVLITGFLSTLHTTKRWGMLSDRKHQTKSLAHHP